MRILLVIALWLTTQPSATITVSAPQVGLGETITYTVTTDEPWLTVTLSEEMTITATTPDCIMQPSYGAYCILDGTDTLTITARLDRLSCGPLTVDAVIADTVYIQGPSVLASPITCLYLPIM